MLNQLTLKQALDKLTTEEISLVDIYRDVEKQIEELS